MFTAHVARFFVVFGFAFSLVTLNGCAATVTHSNDIQSAPNMSLGGTDRATSNTSRAATVEIRERAVDRMTGRDVSMHAGPGFGDRGCAYCGK